MLTKGILMLRQKRKKSKSKRKTQKYPSHNMRRNINMKISKNLENKVEQRNPFPTQE